MNNDAKCNDASLPVALSKDALLLVAKKEQSVDRDRDYEHELSQETLVMGSDDIAKYEDLVEAACKPEKDDDDRRTGEPAVGGNGMRNRSRSPRAASKTCRSRVRASLRRMRMMIVALASMRWQRSWQTW